MSPPDPLPESSPRPSAGARGLVLALIVLLPLLAMVPNLSGWMLSDPPQSVFLGFRHLPEDHYQYATFVAQAREDGRFFMRDLLTPDEHPGRFLAAYPWLVGRFAALAGLDDAEAWLLLQYPAGVLALLAAWVALGAVARTPSQRLVGFLLAALAAGLDWIAWLLESAGVAQARPFAVPFATYWNSSLTGSLALPMWAVAQAILLVMVALLVAQAEGPRRWRDALLFACAPACWAVHPYTGMAAYAVAASIPLVRPVASLARGERPDLSAFRARLRAVAPVLVSFVPMALELAWASRDPAVAHASAQALRWTSVLSPVAWPLVLTLPFLLAWFGWRACRAGGDARDEILVAWLVAVVLLALNPWFSGYKFQYLVVVPLCALAARGCDWLRANVGWFDAAWRRRLPVAVLAFFTIGTLYAPVSDIRVLAEDEAVFASADELAALEHVRQQPPGIVLAPPKRGALAAWKTLHPVHYGHFFLTMRESARKEEATRFLDPRTHDDWRRGFLAASRVRWVVVPPEAGGRIGEEAWGRVAYESGGWSAVEVRLNLSR